MLTFSRLSLSLSLRWTFVINEMFFFSTFALTNCLSLCLSLPFLSLSPLSLSPPLYPTLRSLYFLFDSGNLSPSQLPHGLFSLLNSLSPSFYVFLVDESSFSLKAVRHPGAKWDNSWREVGLGLFWE
jgi:hypothetical protein